MIITIHDIRDVLKREADYDALCSAIPDCVEDAMNTCFGWNFPELLLDSCIEYEGADWCEDDEYTAGDIVKYRGCYYESEFNGTNPMKPDCNPNWSKLPRYDNACYQELFDRYLKKWLAYLVIANNTAVLHIELSSDGLTTSQNATQKSTDASIEWYNKWVAHYYSSANKVKKNMVAWMKRVHPECDFGTVSFIESECGKCEVKTRRHQTFHHRY